MTLPLAHRLDAISPSLTLSLDDRVRTMIAEGRPIVNLTVGQPDFDTPAWIGEAARAAIVEGHTRYTSPMGTPELRRAAAAWLRETSGIEYAVDEILVCNGSKHALYNVLRALVTQGDEVIVPAPYWVSYPDLVRMSGAVPVHPVATLESGYKLTPASLEAAITPRTRAIILNSPGNPTGAVFSRAEAVELARVILAHDIAVISDEIYDRILYDGAEPVSFAGVLPGMRERTVTVNGVSKAYAMTGWRVGFAAGPRHVIEGMGRYQAQATGNPSSISQKAALAAISRTGPELALMQEAYARRRQLLVKGLAGVPHIEWKAPQGAFYFLIRVAGTFGRRLGDQVIRDADDLAGVLLDRGLALVPGRGFGAPDCLRLSFAASDADLEKGIAIIRSTFQLLEPVHAVTEKPGP
jgi:aspartate aminotransferase